MDRRTFVAAAGGALTTGLAGCAGSNDPESGSPTDESAGTTTDTPMDGTDDGDGGGVPYSVTMAPVGEVTFEAVPETFSVYESGYADMGVALGMGDGLLAVGNKGRYNTEYYAELDGVTLDVDGLTELYQGGLDKEQFLELGSDVHLIDPEWFINNWDGWERSDVDQIVSSVGPFIGNTIFRRTDAWHEYEYYTLYEAFEKVAQVFRREDRYEAFESFHDDVLSRVQADLPDEGDRPSALLCYGAGDEPEAFSPYRLSGKGTNKKQFHDLGIEDALEESGIGGLSTNDRGQIDFETLLEVDPETILVRGHETKTEAEFRDTVLAFMREHDVASELTAVQEERVFRGGPIYQGPIHHLFNLERFATNFYPDTFSGELFDRAELSAIVRGEF